MENDVRLKNVFYSAVPLDYIDDFFTQTEQIWSDQFDLFVEYAKLRSNKELIENTANLIAELKRINPIK